MRESQSGDYVAVEDAARCYDALMDMVLEFNFFAVGYSKDHPIQVALEKAKDVIIDYQWDASIEISKHAKGE